jgi:hypothetical protein
MAYSVYGPYKRVPDWALLAMQWIPENVEDIQASKPLYITEPGRQRNRKATDGEREMVAIVALKNFGKSWEEISILLGIPRRVLEVRRDEILRVVKDLEQIGNKETVFLGKCQSLKDGWIGHAMGGHQSGKRTAAARIDDDEDVSFRSAAAYDAADSIASAKAERESEIEGLNEAVSGGDLTSEDAFAELARRDVVEADKIDEQNA